MGSPTPHATLAVRLDKFMNFLIVLAPASYPHCHFKFQNQSRDTKAIRGQK